MGPDRYNYCWGGEPCEKMQKKESKKASNAKKRSSSRLMDGVRYSNVGSMDSYDLPDKRKELKKLRKKEKRRKKRGWKKADSRPADFATLDTLTGESLDWFANL